MRFIITLGFSLVLIGCATGNTKLAFNRFILSTEYGGSTGYFDAVDKLTKKAEDLCDEGYRKLHDYDTGQAEDKLLVWEVACHGADRQDEVQTIKVGA